jgi:flagellar assembly factor FliW
MDVVSSRFGTVRVETGDVLRFPHGIVGMAQCREWVLLADGHNGLLGWLQSLERPHVALAVTNPQRFVSDYRVRVSRRDLAPLQIDTLADAHVLVIVGKNDGALTLNLKAPLVVNLPRRLAAQVVARDEHPLQYEVMPFAGPLKKIA